MDETKVKAELEALRPLLQRDGGDVIFVSLENDVLKVRLVGTCVHCPMASITVKRGLEARLKANLPDLKAVEAV